MASPTSVDDFLGMVRKSGLVSEESLNNTINHLFTPESGIDLIAETLVKAGLLTRFQSKQMKQGRYKRFTLAGKYRLLELLGVGGMGAVYLCEHTFMKRLVAVKVLPVEKIATDPTALQRFYREARAVAALDHPNIVRAYDIDKFESLHFLVMEYVDGLSLQEIVARYTVKKRFFDPIRAVNYIAQAAHGLQHAGELNLIHRDIKPGNLLLDRHGVVKILDMGLARFFDDRHDGLTEKFDDKCILGTADYLAPEQATNDVVDIRADIYGLGGTLYYMLTGYSPFPDGSIAQKLLAHQRQEPKPIASFRKDVPEELIQVIQKMMAKDVKKRYQTPAEVLEALAPWTNTPIGPPLDSEMPNLCPAVMSIIGSGSQITRSSSHSISRYVSGAPSSTSKRVESSGESKVQPGADYAQSLVATTKVAATQPMTPVIMPPTRKVAVEPTPLPSSQISRKHPPAPMASKWPLYVGIAVGSFACAMLLFLAIFLIVLR